MRKLFLRSFAIAFIAFALLFGSEFFLEWRAAGYPSLGKMSWAGVNNGKLVDVLGPMARAYNNVLAMLIATIALAIPLTANMHTPKLIEMFLKDRVNRYVLSFMAIGAAHVLFVAYIIGPEFAPTWAIALAVYMALVGWALLIPYFFYIVRFVDPSRLLIRIRDDANSIVHSVAERNRDPQDAQTELATRVGQIGTIIIKSLDRNDRDVAAEGAWAIKVLLDNYEKHKSRMPKEWFVVDRADFVGLSDEALEMLSEGKTWFEMKCLQQLEHGFLRALHSANDSVSTFSDATRVIATRADHHHDEQALRLCIRFFNNFLREAIKARNLRAVYDVFHQYRRLAAKMCDRPEILRDIGKHFSYYAGMARNYGMLFAPQLAIFDLGFVTRRAYERASPAAPDLLREVLSLPHRTGNDVHSMAVKAKLILGGFFIENKREHEAELVRKNLSDVSSHHVERAEAELLAAERSFFEVTDRQLNLEFIPLERREPLKQFCDSLQVGA
ncbi:MAG: DUF2254 domain-containing protein [Deltaproteobacteria bacterium]|nr:DUF2254 domain-containing protein [Deltaproteobacteria bacterium]